MGKNPRLAAGISRSVNLLYKRRRFIFVPARRAQAVLPAYFPADFQTKVRRRSRFAFRLRHSCAPFRPDRWRRRRHRPPGRRVPAGPAVGPRLRPRRALRQKYWQAVRRFAVPELLQIQAVRFPSRFQSLPCRRHFGLPSFQSAPPPRLRRQERKYTANL